MEAARSADILCDHELAERLARAAIAGADRFDAQLVLGGALLGQNRFEETVAALSPLLGTEPSDADRERLADTMTRALGYGLGRLDEGLEVLERIERDVTDSAIAALLQGHRATLLAFGARFAEAAELGLAALASADNDTTRVRSLSSIGASLMMAGRIDEALALSDGTLETALRLRDRLPRALSWVVTSRCSALFLAGRAGEALSLLDFAVGEAANLPAEMMPLLNAYRARALLFQGRALAACRLLSDALVTLRDNPSREPSWGLALAAESYALLGRHDEAKAAALEAASRRRTGLVVYEVDERRALAWVDAQNGLTSSAITQLWSAAELAAARGQTSFELVILHDLLRLGEHGASRRAQRLAEHVDGAWSAAIAFHATALLSAETSAIEAAAEAFAAMGSSLVAAELWATASAAWQREGLRVRATRAARNSATLAQLCEGAWTPALEWAGSSVPLSRRERETALLASKGATNAQIAAELSVSLRTVETHLYKAFAKLGVTDRSQLSDAL